MEDELVRISQLLLSSPIRFSETDGFVHFIARSLNWYDNHCVNVQVNEPNLHSPNSKSTTWPRIERILIDSHQENGILCFQNSHTDTIFGIVTISPYLYAIHVYIIYTYIWNVYTQTWHQSFGQHYKPEWTGSLRADSTVIYTEMYIYMHSYKQTISS